LGNGTGQISALCLSCAEKHRSAHFTAHQASEHQAIFVLGMKKCGSSLFNTIVQRLCAANVPGYLSLPDHSFQ
jgi:hypothetical protein